MSPRGLCLFIYCLTVPAVAVDIFQSENKFVENVALIVESLMPPGTKLINVYFSVQEMFDEISCEALNQIIPALQALAPVCLGGHQFPLQLGFIFTDSILHLTTTLDLIGLTRNEVRGSLVIYFSMSLDETYLVDIFTICRYMQIVNVHIIVEEPNHLNLLTNFPFEWDDCYGYTPALVCVSHGDGFRSVDGGKCTAKLKRFTNFHGCVVTVKVFHSPPLLFLQSRYLRGLEADILNTLSEKMNFTAEILDYDLSDIKSQKRVTPLISATPAPLNFPFQFQTLQTDVSLGRLRTTSFQQANFTSSFTYCNSKLLLIIHSGRSLFSLERILIPASPTIWLIMFLFTAAAFCTFRALSFASPSLRDLVLGADNRYPTYWSWVIIFGGAVELRPRGLSARLILVHWIVFYFLLRCGYQSFVYTSIRLDWKLSTPNTFMGVLREGYQLTANTDIYRSLQHIRHFPHLIRPYEQTDLEALHQLEQHGESKVAIVVPEEVYRYHLGMRGRSNLTVVGKALLEQMISMHFQDQSLLKEPFDLMLGRMQVSGLLHHWLEAYLRPKHRGKHDVNAPEALRWKDVKGHFQIYGVLLVVSCGTLLLEGLSLRLPLLRRIFFS